MKRPYREIVIRDKARVLSRETGISFERALALEKAKRDSSDLRLKCMKKRARKESVLRKEMKVEKKLRDRSTKEFGVKLVPGLSPYQGGAPGNGKKR